MNWYWYPAVGIVLAFVLTGTDVVNLSSRLRLALAAWLWPIVLLGLAWHGISVLRWNHRHRTRVGAAATDPARRAEPPPPGPIRPAPLARPPRSRHRTPSTRPRRYILRRSDA